jgi:O-antigen/teichoic acid export membrane protein
MAWLDVVLLGILATSHEAGVYATLSRYLLIGTLGLAAIALAISPLLSNLFTQHEFARVGELYQIGTAWLCSLAFPIYVLMAVFAPSLMHLFGSSFSDGARPLAILSLAMIANVGTGPVVMVLLMGGRSDLALRDSAVAFGANIALNALLIPQFGMTGAAVAWATSIVLMNGLAVIQVRRLWSIHPFGRALALIAGSSVGSYGVLGLVLTRSAGMGVVALAATFTVGTVLYGFVLWRLRWDLQVAVLRAAWRERRTGLCPGSP